MKFLFDNNLPPAWAKAVAALSEGRDQRVSAVVPLREKFGASTSDEEFLRRLVAEGEWVVLSKDGFRKSTEEKNLIRRGGLAVFVLAPAWSKQTYWVGAVQLIRWWPKIVDAAAIARAALRVPWNLGSRMESL